MEVTQVTVTPIVQPITITVTYGSNDAVQVSTGSVEAGYTHRQPVPAAIWTINHDLGFWPNVIVYDTSGNEVRGEVTNPTVNQTVLRFSAPFGGTARLN